MIAHRPIAQLCTTLAAFGLAVLGDGATLAAEVPVYILTGQSNSLGTTSLEGGLSNYAPGDDPADGGIEFFWSNVAASNNRFPPTLYGDSGGAVVTLQMQQGDGGANPAFWGPEFGFARTMLDAGQTDLLVIKASRGGGGNSLWDKTVFESNHNNGHMWGHLVDTVDAALAAVDGRGDTFTVKGLMYLQGESNNAAEAAAADTRLADLVANLQAHVDAACPGAADGMHTVVGGIAASGSNANRQLTTQKQMALANRSPDVSFVATSDLPLKSDGIHFGRDAKLAIGERFAEAFIAVVPEPAALAMTIGAAAGLLCMERKRR